MNTKKIFIVFFLAVVGMVCAQAQKYIEQADQSKSVEEQAFIKSIIEEMDKELVSFDKEPGMSYDGTSVEGKNIICSVTIDESQFGGLSMKEVFKMAGVDEAALVQQMRDALFSQRLTTDEREGLQMLKDYGYKVYICFVGSVFREKMCCMLDYEAIL